jgi:hypothetical protein
MAAPLDQTNQGLATRLISAADGIINPAAIGLERDLRDAAERIQEIDRPMAVIPRLVSDLARIATAPWTRTHSAACLGRRSDAGR